MGGKKSTKGSQQVRRRKPASKGAPRRDVGKTRRRPTPPRAASAPKSRRKQRKPAPARRRSPSKRRPTSRRPPPATAATWFWPWVGRSVISAGLGLMVGGSVVVGVLHHQAVRDVEDLLSTEMWSASGRVLSAPLAAWPGLTVTPGQLAEDLQSAGYARVRTLQSPGDFVVSRNEIQVRTQAGSSTIGFSDGRISSTRPGSMLYFRPVELAELRGPEGISRRPVSLDDVPEHVYQGVLAMEDARFFDHEGVDPIGIVRAVMANLTGGGVSQGGSTITQQLVKNLFLTAERTYERKAREALLAVALENTRSKKEILELYLNEIYLGQIGGASISGIDQAARVYFGKSAQRLDVGEAAVLAGIISAPNRYSPLRHPERALAQRDKVLDRMLAVGWLTESEHAAEIARPLQLAPTPTHRQGPWLVEAAIEEVESAVGESGVITGQGWTVHTTLQPGLQRIAERVVREGLSELADEHDVDGAEMALVALRASDGAVLAMVGGGDYASSQFNRVTSASRQIGSTVKPLTVLAALTNNTALTPATVFDDAPLERTDNGQVWRPGNYDGRYVGPISMRQALAQSRNIPAILVAEDVGMPTLKRFWHQLGLENATEYPSASLGSFAATPLALAGAYTIFANEGEVSTPRSVNHAVTASGEERYTNPAQRTRLSNPEATWMTTSMMAEVFETGTARSAARHGLTGPAAGKTGTTDEARDAWFVGFTGDVVVAVWVGHDRDDALGLTGGQAALPTWTRFVVESGLPLVLPEPPQSFVQTPFCEESGLPVDCHGPCAVVVEEWVSPEAAECAEPAPSSPLREAVGRLLGGTTPSQPMAEADADTPQRGGFFRRLRD